MFVLLRVLHTIARAQCSSANVSVAAFFKVQFLLLSLTPVAILIAVRTRERKKFIIWSDGKCLHCRSISRCLSLTLATSFSSGIYSFAICFMLCDVAIVIVVVVVAAVIFYFQSAHENSEDDFAQTILSILECWFCSTSAKFDVFSLCASVLFFYSY